MSSKRDITQNMIENNDFTIDTPDSYSDIVLVVEGKEFYCSKTVLSYASPVFAKMFQAEFKEKDQRKIPLPKKKYDDIRSFLLCIDPGTLEDITDTNVEAVLPLADEYQVMHLKRKCGRFIENWITSLPKKLLELSVREQLVSYLLLAHRYNMASLYETAVENIACRPWKVSSIDLEKANVADKIKIEILSLRMNKYELNSAKIF